MRRWMALPAALLLLVLVIAGCGGGGSSSSSSESTEATETEEAPAEETKEGGAAEKTSGSGKKVFYISPVAAQPGQQQINQGLEQASKELGWSETVLDSALSAEKQVSNVETAINQSASAIASWTLDPNAVAGAYEQAQSKEIPIIGMNSKGTGVTSSVWWEVQLCEPGGPEAVTAEKIAELKPHAKTIVIGLEVAESTKELSDCFVQEAKKNGLEIINETNNEADNAAGSQKVFEPLLTKYPEVEAVFDYNDESAMGVSAALLAGGKTIATVENPEGVIVTGSNGDQDAIEAVEEGRLSWTWDPDNLASGFAAVKQMNSALEGEKPQDLIVESILVDGETISEYVPASERKYTLEEIPVKPAKGEVKLAS
ncbi:MAG TPA: sugar ABC transporter substrate-binding protein [Solirubrobacterales bacterium]|nr:sugar ABC transporter substrate-binding protein [Solirubrobacterales bacterium]